MPLPPSPELEAEITSQLALVRADEGEILLGLPGHSEPG